MSHSYPLAETAQDALKPDMPAARTRADAERLAPGSVVAALETEWLSLAEGEAEAVLAQANASIGQGFVQRYEDASGAPVLAVTYWKLVPEKREMPAKVSPKPSKEKRRESDASEAVEAPAEVDHTDDLYFRSGRTKPRRKSKPVDPNQLDLFGKSKGEETG